MATDVDDLFERLEASGRLVRIDPAWPATMYRGTMLSARELEAVRQIEDVVRLGRVRRIEADRIVLERDLLEWVAQSRLNLVRALPDHAAEPSVQTALKRYLTHLGAATERLMQLPGSSSLIST